MNTVSSIIVARVSQLPWTGVHSICDEIWRGGKQQAHFTIFSPQLDFELETHCLSVQSSIEWAEVNWDYPPLVPSMGDSPSLCGF